VVHIGIFSEGSMISRGLALREDSRLSSVIVVTPHLPPAPFLSSSFETGLSRIPIPRQIHPGTTSRSGIKPVVVPVIIVISAVIIVRLLIQHHDIGKDRNKDRIIPSRTRDHSAPRPREEEYREQSSSQ
jgi:hypothetical protein